MYRTIVILRHTFLEAVLQPIYSLILGLGATIILVFAALPFFTLGEDVLMYKDVCLDMIMLLVLVATLFATSKSDLRRDRGPHDAHVDEQADCKMGSADRKILRDHPLGAVPAIAALGTLLILRTWWRLPADYRYNVRSLVEFVLNRIFEFRLMNFVGLVPSLVLIWLEVCVLAAISVAISTRMSLVVNLPSVILIYLAGNLTRFLSDAPGGPLEGRGPIVNGLASVVKTVIPDLENFDLRQRRSTATSRCRARCS